MFFMPRNSNFSLFLELRGWKCSFSECIHIFFLRLQSDTIIVCTFWFMVVEWMFMDKGEKEQKGREHIFMIRKLQEEKKENLEVCKWQSKHLRLLSFSFSLLFFFVSHYPTLLFYLILHSSSVSLEKHFSDVESECVPFHPFFSFFSRNHDWMVGSKDLEE